MNNHILSAARELLMVAAWWQKFDTIDRHLDYLLGDTTLKDNLDRVKSERDYYLLVINEKTEELSSIKAEYQLQLKEVAKLERTKARLDELTQQIHLLRVVPTDATNSCCHRQENSSIPCCHLRNHSTVSKPLTMNAASDVEQSTIISEAARCGFSGCNRTSDQRHDNLGEPIAQERSAMSLRKPDESLRITEHSATGSTSSKTLLQLQHRLAELEKKMVQAAEEKASLRIRNNQMADLLFRMTQHNQKLIRVSRVSFSTSS
ncbi:unnamed protein product [Dicrocoelium dendriticum]|nr:unnamed protein product [Dicrocoelium dendriticum]